MQREDDHLSTFKREEDTPPGSPSVESEEQTARNFDCPECHMTFVEQVKLKEHRYTHVAGRHECAICHARCRSSHHLARHMRVHRLDAALRCKICNATFARRPPLLVHLAGHSERRPFRCDFCDSRFAQHRPWLEHVRIHKLRAQLDNQAYAAAAAAQVKAEAEVKAEAGAEAAAQGRPSPAS
ncbi:hypothetical protein R5R35_010697 [Gryllus longicercus]|uniref:C2H2-type domain-containing protein n=1 Tax=Gryllus longicercus TaxID=2509291 RepID=A0AAN9VCC1_9ORTH